MNIIYCDCFSGISGDMFLGAMVDAGLPLDVLKNNFQKINLPEFRDITVKKVRKGALIATQIDFDLVKVHLNHEHRSLSSILEIIKTSGLSDGIKQKAIDIFTTLGDAEAKIHGIPLEEVQFHEVGASDSILDIVGAAIALDFFNVKQVYASPIPLGSGMITTQHGLLPLPAPATLELLTRSKALIVPKEIQQELTTPTGAAILATFAKYEQPAMRLEKIGIGAGKQEFHWPNVLRVLLGEEITSQTNHIEIETNIDDMNPQFYASVMKHLFDNGALDVYFTPIQMKKNRPGIKLSVIALKQNEAVLTQLILRETSTMGVRVKEIWRHKAVGEMQRIKTRYGEVTVKLKRLNGKVIQASPEYEDCLALAEKLNIPVADIYRETLIQSDLFLENE
ncbi:TPA: nickel pincer cofactor biosynthesis protein LarC [Candidatus Poribacteria bacterium]|nr:nickel pincer cofactor biosynthesis protein LarC [Candidatus Poribacteria bacterium]